MIGEEPAWIAVNLPKRSQAIQDRLWQRYAPLPVALADDAKLQIGAVDGADFQCRGLAYAQPTGVHESKAGFVNGIPRRPAALGLARPTGPREVAVAWAGEFFF